MIVKNSWSILEVFFIAIWVVLEFPRLYFGYRGNIDESVASTSQR